MLGIDSGLVMSGNSHHLVPWLCLLPHSYPGFSSHVWIRSSHPPTRERVLLLAPLRLSQQQSYKSLCIQASVLDILHSCWSGILDLELGDTQLFPVVGITTPFSVHPGFMCLCQSGVMSESHPPGGGGAGVGCIVYLSTLRAAF